MRFNLSHLIVFLFVATHVAAQKGIPAYNEIPAGGLYLTEGWKYNPADKTVFAEPGYEDSQWDTVNPTEMLHYLPHLKGTKTGWLRLRFSAGTEYNSDNTLAKLRIRDISGWWLVTDFDENFPKANIIPQDIGRVSLNLFTNAFYAIQQKNLQLQFSDEAYNPVIEISTRQKDGFIETTVKDNGTGIPNAIKDKILQPFFTTKPSGEGMGSGLSLSYDIVTKGHGRSIDIQSTEWKGSEFIIRLPQ